MSRLPVYVFMLTISLPVSGIAFAEIFKFNDLIISNAWIRKTPNNQYASAGYLTIKNIGGVEKKLLAVHAEFAERSEIHWMRIDNDVMKMRHLKDGITIPAQKTTYLKPGGYHLMFINLKKPLSKMDTHQVKLIFENKGHLVIQMKVLYSNKATKHAH